jgi:hypothetical protein
LVAYSSKVHVKGAPRRAGPDGKGQASGQAQSARDEVASGKVVY